MLGVTPKHRKDDQSRRVGYRPVPFKFSSPRVLLASLFLAVLILAAYWRAIDSDFITLDDSAYVTGNGIVQVGLTGEGLRWAFTTTYQANWHPLTWLSHMLDCQLYGMNPKGHHLSSILLHAANAVLLFLVLSRMTGLLWQSGFAAALFALHPLHVESVAWVAERKDVLSTFFWMLTLLAYIRYVERPGFRRYTVVLAALALGLMAKPMLVTLPFVLLLLDHWPLHRLGAGGGKEPPQAVAWERVRAMIWEKLLLFLLGALSGAVTSLAQYRGGAAASLQELPFRIRFENALVSYVRYIQKFFWPRDLAVFYPHPGDSLPLWQAQLASLLLVLATLGALWVGRRHAYVPAGWFWYLGTLVPVIGLVQVGTQSMADRYTYVPLIGLAIVIAWGVPDLLLRRGKKADLIQRRKTTFVAVAAGVLVLILTAATSHQVGYWRNSIALFEHSLSVTRSNYTMHTNLGLALANQGRHSEAIAQYHQALALRPDGTDALNNLAWLKATNEDERLRDGATAVLLAKRACELTGYDDPTFLDTLAAAYAEAGRYEEAIQTEQKAIAFALSLKQGEPVSVLEERIQLYRSYRPYRALPLRGGR